MLSEAGMLVRSYRPTPSASTSISAKREPHLAQTFYELGGATATQRAFQNAITRAKTGTYGASGPRLQRRQIQGHAAVYVAGRAVRLRAQG